jgi:hypothetical protein
MFCDGIFSISEPVEERVKCSSWKKKRKEKEKRRRRKVTYSSLYIGRGYRKKTAYICECYTKCDL